jgi:hypothetical protein
MLFWKGFWSQKRGRHMFQYVFFFNSLYVNLNTEGVGGIIVWALFFTPDFDLLRFSLTVALSWIICIEFYSLLGLNNQYLLLLMDFWLLSDV